MSALDDLAEKLNAAASNPPKLAQTRVTAPNPVRQISGRTSTGAPRMVLRSSIVQRQAVREMQAQSALASARQSLIEQAKKDLT